MAYHFPDPSDLSPNLSSWKWRGQQDRIFNQVMGAQTPHVALCLPTGMGKSLFGATLGEVWAPEGSGESTIILTSTRALQDQYNRDFPHLLDLRGRANYGCISGTKPPFWSGEWTCEDGQESSSCDRLRPELMFSPQVNLDGTRVMPCPHRSALYAAKVGRAVVTNYAAAFTYDLHMGRDLTILDEAHDAVDQVCDAAAGKVYMQDAAMVLVDAPPPQPPDHVVVRPWIEWAKRWASIVEMRVEMTPPGMMRRRISRLARALTRIAALDPASSTIEHGTDSGGAWSYVSPVWPKSLMVYGRNRTVWMSATFTPQVMGYFGIPTKQVTYITCKSPFPIKDQPVYFIKSGVRVSKDSTDGDLMALVDSIDRFIRGRLDRKGIIVTTSYAYQKIIYELSDYRGLMFLPDRSDTRDQVKAFKEAKAPAIIISPALSTGWDFPGDECSYIVIPKVPIPDTRSPLMSRRCSEDKTYRNYLTMQTIMQVAGRGNRHLGDRCEVAVFDDNIRWFWPRNRHLAAPWFADRISWADGIPDPMIL